MIMLTINAQLVTDFIDQFYLLQDRIAIMKGDANQLVMKRFLFKMTPKPRSVNISVVSWTHQFTFDVLHTFQYCTNSHYRRASYYIISCLLFLYGNIQFLLCIS